MKVSEQQQRVPGVPPAEGTEPSRRHARRSERSDGGVAGRNTEVQDHDPDNHDGVITHLEPDILECEVKWALGSILIHILLHFGPARQLARS